MKWANEDDRFFACFTQIATAPFLSEDHQNSIIALEQAVKPCVPKQVYFMKQSYSLCGEIDKSLTRKEIANLGWGDSETEF